ncbi:MAG: hypothetical protein QOF21_871 [Actinomycetota bacterium]|jgi:5-methylcytosine-specific restriction endonuclease McrA
MSGALVLNATFEPLCIVAPRRALNLILQTKAEMVSSSDQLFRSATQSFPSPSVVRLIHFIKVPYTTRVALNRRAVFARDNYRCQYCHATAENIDHVVPRSRGGTHTWDNVVAACKACNARKEDRLLHEINMHLRRAPSTPHARAWVIAATGSRRPDWEPWLGMHATAAASA